MPKSRKGALSHYVGRVMKEKHLSRRDVKLRSGGEITDSYVSGVVSGTATNLSIEKLKALGGYVTADVIDVNAHTPGLDAMLARFNREHWHDEDEVRFIIHGRGLFHIRPIEGPVISIEVEAGDLMLLPKGTWHWFDLCADREIRAIRLFQNPSGWTPYYTESGVDKTFQPICFGPLHIPGQV